MRIHVALLVFLLPSFADAGLLHWLFGQDDVYVYPEPKYFKESKWDQHYSDRFAKDPLEEDPRQKVIIALVQSYLTTMSSLKVQTWLMHGTLLAWWWGKRIMPWDSDADVQITEADMFFLAAYYNMTTYRHRTEALPEERAYLLEINPYFKHRDPDDMRNLIDARWIDMETGLFIDITAARYALNHSRGEGILFDKNGHEFRDTYLYPLRRTTFENVPALIPYRYEDMLRSEYGKASLTNIDYNGYLFDKTEKRWVKKDDMKAK